MMMTLYFCTSRGVATKIISTRSIIDMITNHSIGKIKKNTKINTTNKITIAVNVIKNLAYGFLTSMPFMLICSAMRYVSSVCLYNPVSVINLSACTDILKAFWKVIEAIRAELKFSFQTLSSLASTPTSILM